MEIAIVIVNLILLFYFTRMAIHSRQVQVAGKLGPTWVITVSVSYTHLDVYKRKGERKWTLF